MTAKSITISVSGKRNYGDAGNDYVAGMALKMVEMQKVVYNGHSQMELHYYLKELYLM